MPYNPISGEFDYGGESYNAPTFGTGMAMEGMGAVGANVPLAFRMMENIPGITTMALHNARRYSNTMFRGGFLDVTTKGSPKLGRIGAFRQSRKVAAAQRLGGVIDGIPQRARAESFLFGKLRFKGKIPANKTPLFKASRVTNFTLRPRIFNRMGSVTQLGGVANQGFYTPFQGGSMLESMFGNRARSSAISRGAIRSGSNETMFSGGVLGRMTTMSKAYSLEQKQMKLLAKGTERATARSAKIGKKLIALDKNILTLQYVGRAPGRAVASTIFDVTQPGGVSSKVGMTGLTAEKRLEMARTGMRPASMSDPIASGRLRAISDSSSGLISRSITEYMGTMLDPSQFKGTRAFDALESNIKKALYYSENASSLTGKKAAAKAAKEKATEFLMTKYSDDLGKFGVNSLGKLSIRAFGAGQTKVGLQLARATVTRGLGVAMPGINAVGTASLVYDLTKLAAVGIVSAGNFAKDAVKSMQGSLHKPLFGMGFKDNEVAATSRARGVMAIQNSRLNARSVLGSEAGMMAAHFG